MSKRVVFFNAFHNGDIHVSRGFVRQIMNKVQQIEPGTQFAYAHKMAPNLLSDITNLSYDRNALGNVGSEHNNLIMNGNDVFINTWYGQQQFKYMNRHGISMDTIYDALDDSCKDLWKFSLSDISSNPATFFPVIDYSQIHKAPVENWLSMYPGKKILVENGPALSDQAINFPMAPIIDRIASKHPDKKFILTRQDSVVNSAGNIFFSDNITNRQGRNDLNEISFLSTHCDVIIGRSSGVWAFTINQDNLLRRNIKFLNFSNLVPTHPNKYWLGDKLRDQITYTSTITSTNESDSNKVFDIIDRSL